LNFRRSRSQTYQRISGSPASIIEINAVSVIANIDRQSAKYFTLAGIEQHAVNGHLPRIWRNWRSPSGIAAPVLNAIQIHFCCLPSYSLGIGSRSRSKRQLPDAYRRANRPISRA
jgi:hypothetical protein